ncbi:hypothetical protein [Treponema succinifaciens]|uniref:hypothetical protein n=1 Tax=Treponema succinifaciens TaxID=167 RepID=UPI003FCEA95E
MAEITVKQQTTKEEAREAIVEILSRFKSLLLEINSKPKAVKGSELDRLASMMEENSFICAMSRITQSDFENLDSEGHKQLLLKCGLLSEKYSLGVRVPKDVEVQEESIPLSEGCWKVYLDKCSNVCKVEYGSDKNKVQIISPNGITRSETLMKGAEYDGKGFAKKLLTAAGIETTEKNDLMMQNRMLDDGLFYINKEEGWIEKEKYFLEKITAKGFLTLKDYKDVTVKAVYEDDKGELTFSYIMDGKTENLFVVKASNRQKKRQWPTSTGELNSSPIYTMPNSKGKLIVPYKPEKFPNGKWKITAFEKNDTEEYGPYKIRTNAIRNVTGYKAKKDDNKILIDWEKIKNDKGENEMFEDGHLLIHGGTGRIIENLSEVEKLDARKGTNDYKGTTLGCIRICNLDVYLIVHVLSNYLNIKGNIELEVK